ncbi:MAG: hypothetical protein GQ557_00065 [Mycoplasmataceae bacterium]|nr:hypothetical protein [Mycoplasmataceae bacterium]
MNKNDVISNIADELDISKIDAKIAFETVFDSIEKALKIDKEISLPGFGKFVLTKRSARTARNPQTGEPIQIKASWVVKFKVSKTLKDKYNT